MHERWIQLGAAVWCGFAICAAGGPAAPTTAPAATPTTRPTTLPAAPVAPTPVTPTPVTPNPVAPIPAAPGIPPLPEKHDPAMPPLPAVHQSPAPVTQPAPRPAVGTTAVAPLPAPVPKPTTQPGPIDERLSYLFAYGMGKRMRDLQIQDGRTADMGAELKGYIDGVSGHEPAYSREDMQALFAEFQAYTLQRRAEKQYADNPSFRKNADDNLKKSRAVLEQNREMAGVDVRPDGVQVLEQTAGTGRIVGNAKTLTVKNLRVSLADDTLVKSTDGDQLEKFTTAEALPALMEAIRGMRVGTKCRIWLPPEKAYGLPGKPPVIGPHEAIEYEFELINAE